MSLRTRGQEVQIRVLVDGEQQEGSWFKVKDFTATPRHDLIEEDYLGEAATDLDEQYHGFDLAWSVDVQDPNVIDFLTDIIGRSQNGLAHPTVTVNVLYTFREGSLPRMESYQDCFLKVGETSLSGRKEYVTNSFEAKAKTRNVLALS